MLGVPRSVGHRARVIDETVTDLTTRDPQGPADPTGIDDVRQRAAPSLYSPESSI